MHDLLSSGDEYLSRIERKLIPDKLRIHEYKQSVVRECLASYPLTTVKSLLLYTKFQDIHLSEDPGRSAWKETLQFCDRNLESELTERVKARVYELTTSRAERFFLDIRSDLSGLFWKALTYGVVMSHPIIGNTRRREYEKFLEKRISKKADK